MMRAYVSEFIGTFGLVFVGVGSIVGNAISARGEGVGAVGVSLAHGLVLAAMASAVGPISGGHFNPAVTLSAWIGKRIKLLDALIYWVVQVAGAMFAIWLLSQAMDINALRQVGHGTPTVNPIIEDQRALILEAVFTFFLCFVVYGTAFFRRAPKVGALYVGFAIAMAGLAIGPLTGASINPARWLGPAIFEGALTGAQMAVYIGGPLMGAALAGILFGYFLEREPEQMEGTGGPEPA